MSRHREYRARKFSYDEPDAWSEEEEDQLGFGCYGDEYDDYEEKPNSMFSVMVSPKKNAKKGNKQTQSAKKKAPAKAPPTDLFSVGSSKSNIIGVQEKMSVASDTKAIMKKKMESDLDSLTLPSGKGPMLARAQSCPEASTEEKPSSTKSSNAGAGAKRVTVSDKVRKAAEDVAKTRANKVQAELKAIGSKPSLNLVVIGHVDAGKSTMMGHLLFQLGQVDKKIMNKFQHESKVAGKASFAFAWVLDAEDEERERGVTIDVAVKHFETEKNRVLILDAPGHRDFIPNMISGASQADVGVLVVASQKGEFEAGFNEGGQTREHALLARALGVRQLIVAINKMDIIGWDQRRFDEISDRTMTFLKNEVGFKESTVQFVPLSGFTGENLVKSSEEALQSWYKGPTLVEAIDKIESSRRLISRPFRFCVSDVYKSPTLGVTVAGKVESGVVMAQDRLLVLPVGESCTVKGIECQGDSVKYGVAGDNVEIGLGDIEQECLTLGSYLCPTNHPIPIVPRFEGKIQTFGTLKVPIIKGRQLILHIQSAEVPVVVSRLITHYVKDKELKKPKMIPRNASGLVEIAPIRSLCMELFKDFKQLGRFTLRDSGHTIAAGVVHRIRSKAKKVNSALSSNV